MQKIFVKPYPHDDDRSDAPWEIGAYKLLQKIGEGGFGEVWMAEQRAPMVRRVALKIIKLGMDTRTDIYSLGVLLYELLTARTPFETNELSRLGIDEMRRVIREKEPLRPSTRLSFLRADELTTTANRRQTEAPRLIHLLRGDIDWIVMKCIEKDRTRRYETANGPSAGSRGWS